MSRICLSIFAQTTPNQTITLPKPISNVKAMKFQLISATALTSTGSLFWLTCPEVTRTNTPLTTIAGIEQNVVWREVSPLPAARTNYLPPLCFYIEAGFPAANDINALSLRLLSNGDITPGFSIVWEVTWEIAGPDNLLKPY